MPVAASDSDLVQHVIRLIQSSPPTWQSSFLSNIFIFLLVSGLSLSGIAAAFFLGTLTWRTFGSSGFLLVVTYYLLGTAATMSVLFSPSMDSVEERLLVSGSLALWPVSAQNSVTLFQVR